MRSGPGTSEAYLLLCDLNSFHLWDWHTLPLCFWGYFFLLINSKDIAFFCCLSHMGWNSDLGLQTLVTQHQCTPSPFSPVQLGQTSIVPCHSFFPSVCPTPWATSTAIHSWCDTWLVVIHAVTFLFHVSHLPTHIEVTGTAVGDQSTYFPFLMFQRLNISSQVKNPIL